MSRIVYINGDYVAAENAMVSVFDRGFIFGDGVYEVVPVVKGRLVDRDYFLERLERSLAELQIPWPIDSDQYVTVLEELIGRNRLQEGIVYSQVTRGVADREFAFPANTQATLMAFTSAMNILENPLAKTGIAVATSDDIRWKRRDIKSINLLAQCLAKQDAASHGATESWMVEDGFVTEGASSSAYIVKGGVLITRPLSNSILPGIRRRTLLEIAAAVGIGVEQRAFTVAEALQADEAFITSATTLVLAVVRIDGQQVADGNPGPVTGKLRELYKGRMLAEAGN
ncbi:MAG: D-amino-acid transaminase [Gammaproteobacteria bacterium]